MLYMVYLCGKVLVISIYPSKVHMFSMYKRLSITRLLYKYTNTHTNTHTMLYMVVHRIGKSHFSPAAAISR